MWHMHWAGITRISQSHPKLPVLTLSTLSLSFSNTYDIIFFEVLTSWWYSYKDLSIHSFIFYFHLQRKGVRVQISRSLSVPINNKERSIRRMDSFFRVIPSTPRVKDGDAISNASPTKDAGNFIVLIFLSTHDCIHEYQNLIGFYVW